MSINDQGHSLTLVKGHSDFKVKCLNFGLYTQVSDSGPLGPLVLLLSENIHCDPSLEPSQRDGSNEGSRSIFSWKNREKYSIITPDTPSYLGPGRMSSYIAAVQNLSAVGIQTLCF